MKNKLSFILSCICIFCTNAGFSQWNPQAGVIPSFTDNATITASSTSSGLQNVLDNNMNTSWQSGAPFPSGFIDRPDQNFVFQQAASICTGTGSTFMNITDGNTNTAETMSLQNAHAQLNMNFGTGHTMLAVAMKLSTSSSVDVYAFTSATDSVLLTNYTNANNYSWLRFPISPTLPIQFLKWYSNASFQVFEVGVITELPQEWVVVDLGSVQSIGQIRTRHWSGGSTSATAANLYVSSNNSTWTLVSPLVHDALQPVITQVSPAINARYIKVAFTMPITDWNKVFMWEVDAYNSDGMYGAFPTPKPSSEPFKSVLGINGIWGWGHNAYSSSLGANEGPRLYNAAARHARNYHAMSWDVTDPDTKPDYVTMAAGGGTQGQWWLNWDQEYVEWKNAGLQIQASIQFLYPAAAWDSAYISAYEYGYEYAKHFGPTFGTGHITDIEVGNEPWEYDSTLYRTILEGMAKGAKAADPAIRVFPCALQAADPYSDLVSSTQNYMGSRVTPANAPYLDGLNVHSYSYINNNQGIRIETTPEDPKSEIRSILGAVRFRDQNMPGKKLYWSEFGWDTDGAGEPCTHNECVSERAGTAYAVRAAMMGWRWGMDRMTWFFYANDVTGSSLYTRSGLTGSKNTNFQKKTIFTAFEALLYNIEDLYFIGVEREDSTAWVYALGDSLGNKTHLIAWKPTDGNISALNNIMIPSTKAALSATKLEGLNPLGEVVATPTFSNGQLSVNIGSVPIVIALDNSTDITPIASAFSPLQIYPNPSSGQCSLQSPDAIQKVIIWDNYGRKIFEKEVQTGSNTYLLATENFAKGLYICEVITEKQQRLCQKLWVK